MELNRPADQMRVVSASANNFARVALRSEMQNFQERPLLLNAWSQTTAEDFHLLWESNYSEQNFKKEQEYLDKIRFLEDSLKQHSDILAQIHATAARRDSLHIQPSQQQLELENTAQHNATATILQHQQSSLSKMSSPGNTSVINSVPNTNENYKGSVKYTIIAEGNSNAEEEPIEIQLAEEDPLMNTSSESGRLEICLADESTEIKNEITLPDDALKISATQTSTPEPTQFIKRRKVTINEDLDHAYHHHDQEHNDTPSPINSYYNSQERLTHLKQKTAAAILSTTKTVPTKEKSKRMSPKTSTLLKMPKLESTSTTPIATSKYDFEQHNANSKIDMDNVMVSIGPNNTRIPAKLYENMNWSSASIATRKLLMSLFGRHTLATHSMTGKPSPAFKDHGKPLKQMLEPLIIQDIIFAVTRKCNVSEKEVRNAITTKCADENKMMKLQENKQRSLRELNKENMCA